MDFPMVDEKDGRYAFVFPKQEENEALKKIALDLGEPKMVAWRGKGDEARWRLYEDRIPAGVDVDEAFGRFTGPEAEEAFKSERAVKQAARDVAGRTGDRQEMPEEKKYYPVVGVENQPYSRGAWDALIKAGKESGNPAVFTYNTKVGAFIHQSGPTEGFEAFQTAEAKAAWEARGRVRERGQSQSMERAQEVADQVAERAKGNHFVADNFRGFLLPGPKHAELRENQLASAKSASNEELERVFQTTQAEFKALERKQYGIQVQAAEANGVATEDFNKMPDADRRKAAGFKGLSNEDFSRLVALKNGFFALREERIDRGMIQTVGQARDQKNETEQASAPKSGSDKKQELKQDGVEQKPAGRAKSRGAAAAAALAADLGR